MFNGLCLLSTYQKQQSFILWEAIFWILHKLQCLLYMRIAAKKQMPIHLQSSGYIVRRGVSLFIEVNIQWWATSLSYTPMNKYRSPDDERCISAARRLKQPNCTSESWQRTWTRITYKRSSRISARYRFAAVFAETPRNVTGFFSAQLKNVDFPMERLGAAPRCVAYVEYDTSEEAEKALKFMDGGQVDGQEISIQAVLPLRRRPPPRRSDC